MMIRSIFIGFLLLLVTASSSASDFECHGAWANPITDVCWSCVFPLKLAGLTIASMDQDDNDSSPGSIVCSCLGKGGSAVVGTTVSFWELMRMIDVTRKPMCFPSLGGLQMDVGSLPADTPGDIRQMEGRKPYSFFHVNNIKYPLMYVAELVLDDSCLEKGSIDVDFSSVFDPTWVDNTLAAILNPDSFLYGNIVAVNAVAAQCVACSSFLTPVDREICKKIHWGSGCNGDTYPLVGDISYDNGGVVSSANLLHREIVKSGRELRMWAASGSDGMCGYYPNIMPDITDYKYAMAYPIPQTEKILGKCCQPIGRSTILWGAGREFPVAGEDFSYYVYRKRDCCQGAVGM